MTSALPSSWGSSLSGLAGERDLEAGERQALLRPAPSTRQSWFTHVLFFFSSRHILTLLFIVFIVRLELKNESHEFFHKVVVFLEADILYLWSFIACALVTCIFIAFTVGDGCFGGCCLGVIFLTATASHWCLLKISQVHHLDSSCIAEKACYTTDNDKPDLSGSRPFFASWLWLPTDLYLAVLGVFWRPFWLDAYVIPASIFDAGPLAHGHIAWAYWREALIGHIFWLTLCLVTWGAYTLQETPQIGVALLIGLITSWLASLVVFYHTVDPMVDFWCFLKNSWQDLFTGQLDMAEGVAVFFMCLWMGQAIYRSASMRLDEINARKTVQEAMQYAYQHPFRAELEENFSMLREDPGGTGSAMVRTLSRLGSRVSLSTENLKDLKEKQQHLHNLMLEAERSSSISASLARVLSISVERDSLLKDSLKILHDKPKSQLLAPQLQVSFTGEQGVDAGGLTRDWFESIAKALLDGAGDEKGDSLLALHEDQTLLPRPRLREDGQKGDERDRQLWAVGVFLALALYHRLPLPLSFSLIACKFFCGRKVGMGDVQRLDPAFFRSRVEGVLKPGGLQELNAALGEPLTFMSAPTRLRPTPEALIENGESELVTDENKHTYVEKLCEAYLCSGMRVEIQLLLRGFWHLIPLEALQVAKIGPGDLSLMISGVQTLDVKEWQANSLGGGTTVHDYFWQIVEEEMHDQQRSCLLHFVTGSSRLPPGGFAELSPKFDVTVIQDGDEERLPVSHTCANQLVLQAYSSAEKLKEKLFLAMQAEGFQFA